MNDRLIERIEQDVDGGMRSGVEGTPTFYINGWRYEKASDEETLVAALERAVSPRR